MVRQNHHILPFWLLLGKNHDKFHRFQRLCYSELLSWWMSWLPSVHSDGEWKCYCRASHGMPHGWIQWPELTSIIRQQEQNIGRGMNLRVGCRQIWIGSVEMIFCGTGLVSLTTSTSVRLMVWCLDIFLV
jgi:hypothetical protein